MRRMPVVDRNHCGHNSAAALYWSLNKISAHLANRLLPETDESPDHACDRCNWGTNVTGYFSVPDQEAFGRLLPPCETSEETGRTFPSFP